VKLSEIHHVAISVSDMERSIAFYRDALGMRTTLQMPVEGEHVERQLRLRPGTKGRSVYLQGPSRIGQVELIQFDPPPDQVSLPKRPGDPGAFLLAIEVLEGEVQEIFERATALGAPVYAEVSNSDLVNYGMITSFIVEDPDGLLIEIIRLPTREEIIPPRAAYAAESGDAA
jgi:lactoylglutathione lyase